MLMSRHSVLIRRLRRWLGVQMGHTALLPQTLSNRVMLRRVLLLLLHHLLSLNLHSRPFLNQFRVLVGGDRHPHRLIVDIAAVEHHQPVLVTTTIVVVVLANRIISGLLALVALWLIDT